jgi:L-ascorbate metabolism protein UlaG (beta-lactamase superfamily)
MPTRILYVDPAKVDFTGQKPATGILITHAHPDHFDPDNLLRIAGKASIVVTEEILGKLPDRLKAQATAMKNGDTGSIDGIPLRAVPAYNTSPDKLPFHPRGVGNGYVLSFGDKKVYIAGDTENTPEMAALTGIDVAFLPMNQPYTMTPEQAASAVKAFKPKIVYPYHSKGTDTQKFAELVGDLAEVRLRDWYATP